MQNYFSICFIFCHLCAHAVVMLKYQHKMETQNTQNETTIPIPYQEKKHTVYIEYVLIDKNYMYINASQPDPLSK